MSLGRRLTEREVYMNILLKTEKLCKTFSSGGVQQHVLKNLDLEIMEGDFTVIMGSSGSGKSTLLYALSGMDQPTLGDVFFENQNIAKMNNDQLALFRRGNCGFVFQQIHLIDSMSVLDNVLTAGLLLSRDRAGTVAEARQLLRQVGLEDACLVKFPAQLSGGEAQRVGIARALIKHPRLLFADEPTGALNSASGINVLDLLTEFNRSGQSMVTVTHDIKTALRGNRILYLRDGIVCGDLRLEPYDGTQLHKRSEQVQRFLDEMGW